MYIITYLCLLSSLFINQIDANYECPFARLQSYQSQTNPYAAGSITSATSAIGQTNSISRNVDKYGAVSVPPSGNAIGTWLQNFFSANVKEDSPSAVSKKYECAIPPVDCRNNSKNYHYRSLDGSCNNLQHPGNGMAKSRFLRLVAPKYGDGVYSPTLSDTGATLPNARLLSLSLYGDKTYSDNYRTMAALQWSQIVAHDLSKSANKDAPKDCCENTRNKLCYPISLHPNGPITTASGKTCINFARSLSDVDAICPESNLPYSEKITSATAYLDMSSVYGNSLEESKKIRLHKGGLLKTTWISNRQWLPISFNVNGECGDDIQQCYQIPDMRNQFIPTVIVLHTILVREHNRLANALLAINPYYSDEELYQEARKINIAQFQKITYYDWLPLIVGRSYAYTNQLIHYENDEYVHDYDPTVNPTPFAEFSGAAFRYFHNTIPGWFSLVAPDRFYNRTMRLSDYFGRSENPNFVTEGDNFDSIIRGMATQLQKRPDANIDVEVKHHFDRKTFEEFGADLKALDIQRSRDYGLGSYNDLRQYCGLPRAYDWSGFSREISPEKIKIMQKLYASPDDVDLNIGGSLETHLPEAILGPTFQCIIGKQFLKTRTGDRFFFEREDMFSGFTREQIVEIRKSSLSSLFCNNADYLKVIQSNSFIFPSSRNVLKSCDAIPRLDLSKWKKVQHSAAY